MGNSGSGNRTELRRLIREHDGVITSERCRAAGVSDAMAHRRVASGEWTRHGRGVYSDNALPMTDRARLRIATERVGPGATLAGTAALVWHGLRTEMPSVITVICPRGRHAKKDAHTGVQVINRELDDAEWVVRSGLRVSALPCAVLESTVATGIEVLDDALLRGRVSLRQLVTAYVKHRGRRGAPQMAIMIDAVCGGARSHAEREFRSLMHGDGITGWVANHPVNGYIVDAAFIEEKIAIEIDGIAFHSDARSFQRDRTKQNIVANDGWLPLRYTWADIIERPAYVLAEIREALHARRQICRSSSRSA